MSSWLAMLQDAAEMFVFLAVELSLLFIVISAGVSQPDKTKGARP